MSYNWNISGFATYPAGTLLVYKKGRTIKAEADKRYDTLHYAPAGKVTWSRPGYQNSYEILDPSPYMVTKAYKIKPKWERENNINKTNQIISPDMYEWKTVGSTQYNVATPEGLALYNAAIGGQTSVNPIQPQQPTQQTTQQPVQQQTTQSGGQYINVNGAYFQQTPSGLAAVNDPNILNQLKSGSLGSTAMSLQDFYGQKTSGTVATPALVPPAALPSNVSEVNNNVPSVNLPTGVDSTFGNVSNASAATASYQKMLDLLFQQQQDYNNQLNTAIAQQQEQSKSFIDSLANRQSAADIRANAFAQAGISVPNYFAEERAKIEEVTALRAEYDKTVAAMQAEKDQAIDRMATTGFVSRQQAAIERKYAPTLNRMSADINSKVANIQALQGQFQEAQNFVNQAVQDATAEQAYQLQLFTTFYSMNQDIINRLSQNYQNAFNTALQLAQNEYNQAIQDANTVGQLMVSNPQAGISVTDSLQTAYAKVAANPQAQKPDIFGSAEGGYYQQTYDPVTNRWTNVPVIPGTGGGGGGNKSDMAQDLAYIATLKTRAAAEKWVNDNMTALKLKYGDSSYQTFVNEVNRLYPITPAAPANTSSGSWLSNLFGGNKTTTPVTAPKPQTGSAKEQISGLFAGYKPLTLDNSAANSFFVNLFSQ